MPRLKTITVSDNLHDALQQFTNNYNVREGTALSIEQFIVEHFKGMAVSAELSDYMARRRDEVEAESAGKVEADTEAERERLFAELG